MFMFRAAIFAADLIPSPGAGFEIFIVIGIIASSITYLVIKGVESRAAMVFLSFLAFIIFMVIVVCYGCSLSNPDTYAYSFWGAFVGWESGMLVWMVARMFARIF